MNEGKIFKKKMLEMVFSTRTSAIGSVFTVL